MNATQHFDGVGMQQQQQQKEQQQSPSYWWGRECNFKGLKESNGSFTKEGGGVLCQSPSNC